jgi:hypothetical protein
VSNNLTNNETLVLKYLSKHKGQWVSPTNIEEAITGKHRSSWASHICLRLVDKGILAHNISGQYRYNKNTISNIEFYTPEEHVRLRSLTPVRDSKIYKQVLKLKNRTVDLECPNGDTYIISALENGLQIKKNSNSNEKISISTCKGDRLIVGDTILYIY